MLCPLESPVKAVVQTPRRDRNLSSPRAPRRHRAGSPLLSSRRDDSPLGPAPQLPMWGMQTPGSKELVTPSAPKRWESTPLLQQEVAPALPAGEVPRLPCFITDETVACLCLGEDHSGDNSDDAELLRTPLRNRTVRTPQAPHKRCSPLESFGGMTSHCGEAPPLPMFGMPGGEACSEAGNEPAQSSMSDGLPWCEFVLTPHSKVGISSPSAPDRHCASSPLVGCSTSFSPLGQAPLLPKFTTEPSQQIPDGLTTPRSKTLCTPRAPKRWSGSPTKSKELPDLQLVPALPQFGAVNSCACDLVEHSEDQLVLLQSVPRSQLETPVKGRTLLCPGAPTKHRQLSPLMAWGLAPPLPTFMIEPSCFEPCLEE